MTDGCKKQIERITSALYALNSARQALPAHDDDWDRFADAIQDSLHQIGVLTIEIAQECVDRAAGEFHAAFDRECADFAAAVDRRLGSSGSGSGRSIARKKK